MSALIAINRIFLLILPLVVVALLYTRQRVLSLWGWRRDISGALRFIAASGFALALAQRHPATVRSLIVVGGFSELDRATELNFRLRLRLIEKLGMSEEIADYMGLWTWTGKSINTDAGYAVMRANQANIRANSPAMYRAFVEALFTE